MKQKFSLLFPFFLFLIQLSFSQVTPEKIRQFINSDELLRTAGIAHGKELREYYAALQYNPCWIGEDGEYERDILLKLLKTAGILGLNEEDYQYTFIRSFAKDPDFLKTPGDSLTAEIKFSDAAIHFLSDLVYGNTKPALSYYGLDYTPGCYNIPLLLAQYYSKNQLCLLTKWESPLPEIRVITQKMAQLEEIMLFDTYKEEKITSAAVNPANKPLLKKLYLLGISDSVDIKEEKVIKEKVKEAQRQFNLMADGVLRSTILQELNIPLSTRLQQLKLAVNYYRWLYCLTREQAVIVVNIPAAYLKVYDPAGVKLEMKVIVGKPPTPTPTLSSRVSEVVLYPYWTVPHSIATKELLPAIKRNPGYVNANNYQVVNKQGKVVNPYKISWHSLSASNFPYTIRQSTGCDNALGLIKLNFYNPFSVYLHDTPGKNLFTLNKRYFSHGCMRMEKPMELGYLALKNNFIAIDTLTEKGCLLQQSPIVVPADEKMPVIVWYNPVGIDTTGRVIYYEDIYKKSPWKNIK
jgi:L,D-transpeptidase YcbB